MNKINSLVVTATVTGKRQITIPKEICEHLNINVGDRVIFREKGGSIVMERDELADDYKMTVDKSFKYNFIIPFHTVTDALVMNDTALFDSVFEMGEEAIKKGGKTIIQKEYTNSPPEIMRVIDSIDELNEVKEKLRTTK